MTRIDVFKYVMATDPTEAAQTLAEASEILATRKISDRKIAASAGAKAAASVRRLHAPVNGGSEPTPVDVKPAKAPKAPKAKAKTNGPADVPLPMAIESTPAAKAADL